MILITKCSFMPKSQQIFINILSNDIRWGGTTLNAYVTKQESITIIILGLFVIFIGTTLGEMKMLKLYEDVMKLLISLNVYIYIFLE